MGETTPDAYHFHVCENCFAIMGHRPQFPAPCNHHDCKKCGEEVDRNGFTTKRGALAEVKRLRSLSPAVLEDPTHAQ